MKERTEILRNSTLYDVLCPIKEANGDNSINRLAMEQEYRFGQFNLILGSTHHTQNTTSKN